MVTMRPIGVVHNALAPGRSPPRARSAESTISIHAPYRAALYGLERGDTVYVIFWFDKALPDAPLQQHPRGDGTQPLRGVFALCSPHRPNPIGLTAVRVLRVEEDRLVVADLDAWDGTPVLDIKPAG